MNYSVLGKTGLKVSELSYGTLALGPLQNEISPIEGGKLIRTALEAGVNFVDTAQMYEVYPHILEAFKGYTGDVILASRSMAESYEDMEKAIFEAMRELNLDYVDMFSLHAPRVSSNVFEVRAGAWECLQEYKQKGYVKAIGIATHSVKAVEVSAVREDVDIVFPIVNFKGMGIREGTLEEMLAASKLAYDNGKGLYAMKALAGGSLIIDYEKALAYVREIPYFSAIALGMAQERELMTALKVFNDQELSEVELDSLKADKSLCILPFCGRCGNCVEACPNDALSMAADKEILIDTELCVLCGYCVPTCSQFAMRLRND